MNIQQQQRQLNREFNALLDEYELLLKFHEGRGEKSQYLIDNIHEKLTAFGDLHPDWKSRVPKKITLYDDGRNGMLAAVRDIWRQRFLDGHW